MKRSPKQSREGRWHISNIWQSEQGSWAPSLPAKSNSSESTSLARRALGRWEPPAGHGAGRGTRGPPESTTGCTGPPGALHCPHPSRSRARKGDAMVISFLLGLCCRFAYKYYFALALGAVDVNLSAWSSLQRETKQQESEAHVFSSALRIVTSTCFALVYFIYTEV